MIIRKTWNTITWNINATPYRYILISMILNLFESVGIIVIYVKIT